MFCLLEIFAVCLDVLNKLLLVSSDKIPLVSTAFLNDDVLSRDQLI
jgi:hypothetical protein